MATITGHPGGELFQPSVFRAAKDLAKEIRDITSILVQASLTMYSAASGKSYCLPVQKASSRKRKRKEAGW